MSGIAKMSSFFSRKFFGRLVTNTRSHVHDESNAEDSTNIKEWVCVMCGYKATQKGNVIEHVHRNHLKGNFNAKTETFEELTEAAIVCSTL